MSKFLLITFLASTVSFSALAEGIKTFHSDKLEAAPYAEETWECRETSSRSIAGRWQIFFNNEPVANESYRTEAACLEGLMSLIESE